MLIKPCVPEVEGTSPVPSTIACSPGKVWNAIGPAVADPDTEIFTDSLYTPPRT